MKQPLNITNDSDIQAMEELCHPKNAAEVLDTSLDVLKKSRCTGLLWGVPAPAYIKIGNKAVRYKKSTLIAWIADLPTEKLNTAQ